MRIALAQQHASPDRAENLARALRAMEQARDVAAGLVALAELAAEANPAPRGVFASGDAAGTGTREPRSLRPSRSPSSPTWCT